VELEPALQGLATLLHLLLFVYWLGGDVGVFYASRFVVDASLTREARLTAAKIFLDLDMIPRYCMALMLTVGGLLAEFSGIRHSPWQLLAIVLLGPAWVALVHLTHARQGTASGRMLARADVWFRLAVIAALLVSAIESLATGRLVGQEWLAAKLVVFAGLIACGLMIRRNLPPFVEGFRCLKTSGPTAESDRLMHDGLSRCRPWVLAIWAGLVVSAALGVFQPALQP